MAGRAVRARAIGGLLALAARALGAADGDLDPSFSGDGKLVVAWESSGSAQAVAAAPDGDVAVAGVVSSEWAVSRVNADGSLDVAWAIGFETFDFAAAGASDTDDVYAARFDPAGRLVVAGLVRDGGGQWRPAVARLTPGGALDATFSGDGLEMVATAPAGWDVGFVSAAHVAVDGRVTFVGDCQECPEPGGEGVFVLRLLAGGQPDPGFSGDGWQAFASFSLPGGLWAEAAIATSDGRVTLVGEGLTAALAQGIWVARLTAAGALDPAFGGGDGIFYPDNLEPRGPTGLAVDPDTGAIVVALAQAGFPTPSAGGGLLGVTGDGATDFTFGAGGLVELDLEEGSRLDAVAFESGGRIVAAGAIDANGAQEGGFFLARLLADGTPDPSFDGNGVKRVEIDREPDAEDAALALTLSAGRLVAAGVAHGDAPARAFAIVRTQSALVFTDGFERGTTSAWGAD